MQLDIFDTSSNHLVESSKLDVHNSVSTLSKITGLKYVPDFITRDEHQELWQSINKEPWLADLKRRVQHYGWKYDYKVRSIDYSMFLGEFPLWAQLYANRLFQLGYTSKAPDQLIINEYLPGQGIANHVDCEPCFGETISSLSLGSTSVMDFINLKTKEKQEVVLEPRSIVIISGEARHNWTHGIAPRKVDILNNVKMERRLRISMTFRNVVMKSCSY